MRWVATATDGGFFDSTNLVDELSVASWPAGSWVASPPNLILPNRQANQAGFYGSGQIWSVGGIVGQTFQFLAEVQRRSNGGGPCGTPTATPTATATFDARRRQPRATPRSLRTATADQRHLLRRRRQQPQPQRRQRHSGDCDRIAAVHTDAATSADTAAASGQQLL